MPEDRQFTAFEADGKLYQYTHLPFGVTNGVSFFQRIVNELIAKYELHDTCTYLDNITMSGVNKSDHDAKLKALIEAAEAEKLTFNFDKCGFAKSEIDLLGYRVSHLKIQPDAERLQPLHEYVNYLCLALRITKSIRHVFVLCSLDIRFFQQN